MSSFRSDFLDDLTSIAREFARDGAWAEVVRVLAPEVTKSDELGELALLYAEALTRVGEAREASDWLRRIIPSVVAHGDRVGHRRALNLLGVASFFLGELEEASHALTSALELASQDDDLLILARATNNLGMIANLRGQHETALGHYRLAVPTYQRLGQRRGLAESYHNIAITYRDIGSLDEADEYERRAIDYAAEGIAPRVAAMGMIGRAEIALRRGDPQFAKGTSERAALELERLHDPMNEADAHRLAGTAATAMGQVAEATAAFGRALSIARARGHALIEAETLRDRAIALLAQDARVAAQQDADAAVEIFARLGATSEIEALRSLLPREDESK
jgi:tetratricopeptide (TPR) repeat protein